MMKFLNWFKPEDDFFRHEFMSPVEQILVFILVWICAFGWGGLLYGLLF